MPDYFNLIYTPVQKFWQTNAFPAEVHGFDFANNKV